MGFRQWDRAKSIISGGDLYLEEMAQVLLVKGQEQVEEWKKWEGPALEQDRAEAVFATVVDPGFLMR